MPSIDTGRGGEGEDESLADLRGNEWQWDSGVLVIEWIVVSHTHAPGQKENATVWLKLNWKPMVAVATRHVAGQTHHGNSRGWPVLLHALRALNRPSLDWHAWKFFGT
jgi:hypothetical protein